MSYGIYDLVGAGTRKINQLDAVTNNLANASTPGFKAEHLHFAMKSEGESFTGGQAQSYLPIMAINYSPGTMQKTGNGMDVAIQGEGFFAVETKNGTAYTRRGNFMISRNKELVTQSGDYVLGTTGRHIAINGSEVHIDNEGAIKVDGNEVGRLKIVTFKNRKSLSSRGDGLFTAPADAGVRNHDKPVVTSGYLELANVQVIKEMVDMIGIQHAFETYQKAVLTITDFDKLSTNRIGRLT